MKKILLVVMIFLISGWGLCEKFKQIIIVTSPKKDKVYLTSGSLPIAWKTFGVFGKLAIHLRKHDDSKGMKLIGGIPAVGNTSYSHPLGYIKPGQYFIRIKQIGTTVKSKSGIFWVRSPPQKPPKLRTIVVWWPKEGTTHPIGLCIYWRYSGLSGDVMITLHRIDSTWFKILCYKCNIQGVGGAWKGGFEIPQREVEDDWIGHSYFIKVRHIKTGIFGTSGVFKID